MKEPLRPSLRHWWNYIFVMLSLLAVLLRRSGYLDGRIVLAALAGWIVIGRVFSPAIIDEHLAFLDRWIFHDYRKARKRYRKAVSSGKATAQAYAALGSLTMAEGDLAEAARLLEEASVRLPRDPHVRYLLVCVLARSGRGKEALAEATRADLLRPGPIGYAALGEALAGCGDLPAAASAYQKAIDLAPSAVRWRVRLAELYEAMGEVDTCLKEVQQALAVDPNDPDALFLAARAWLSKGDSARAQTFARRAMTRRPLDDNSYVFSYPELVRLSARLSSNPPEFRS